MNQELVKQLLGYARKFRENAVWLEKTAAILSEDPTLPSVQVNKAAQIIQVKKNSSPKIAKNGTKVDQIRNLLRQQGPMKRTVIASKTGIAASYISHILTMKKEFFKRRGKWAIKE